MTRTTVRVKGLRELQRDLNRMEGGLAREVDESLREAGELVERETASRIRARGLVRTGKMVGSVRTAVTRGKVRVRVTAARRGFPYPRLREAQTPFLNPALESKRGEVIEVIDRMLARLAGDHGFH